MGLRKEVNKLIKKAAENSKVNEQELHNLRLRTRNKENQEFNLYILNNELRQYINLLLQKYEKTGGEYNINLETGEIVGVKRPKVEAQPEAPAKEEIK